MSERQNNIYEAISIVAEKLVSQVGYDRTIKAVVTKIENSVYRVSYQGNILTVYNDLNVKCEVGDEVFIKVPGDNFSERKIIVGKADDENVVKSNLISKKVTPISIDFTSDTDKIGIIAGKGDSASVPIANAEQFKAYAAMHRKLQLSANFQTIGLENITSGNYGLKVTCGTADGGTVEFIMDTKDFAGRPWEYANPAPQSLVFEVDNPGFLTSIDSITLFQEGIIKTPGSSIDIIVSDVKCRFVEEIEINKKNYILKVIAENGNIFFDPKTETTLKAELWYMGQNIISTAKLQWFVQDSSITTASADYVKDAGAGWKALEGSSAPTLIVKATDLGPDVISKKYKLLAIVEEMDLVLSDIIQIVYHEDFSVIPLKLIESGEKDNLNIEIEIENESLTGIWYLNYNTANQIKLINGEKAKKIDVTAIIKDESWPQAETRTFTCEAYDDKGYYKGIGSLVYTKGVPVRPAVVGDFVGDDIFHYDANGDISFLKYDKEYSLSIAPRLQSTLESLKDISITWSINGVNIPATNIIPADSMIQSIHSESNTIYFTVNHKYNYYKDNNTLVAQFKYEGNDYIFEKKLSFIKDGDQGTNGTSYILVVRPADNKTYGVLDGTVKLKAVLYRDGVIFDENPAVAWTPDSFNGMSITAGQNTSEVTLKLPEALGQKSIKETYIDDKGQTVTETKLLYSGFVVAARSEVDNNGSKWTVSNYYPIDVANKEVSNIEISYPQYVQYNSAGTRPTYDNDPKYFKYGDNSVTFEVKTPNLLTNTTIDTFIPVPSYSMEEQQAGLVSFVSGELVYYRSIVFYINQYSNEFVNSWGGNEIEIDANGQYLIAPQIGAGKKNKDNTFTGVLMGTLINTGDKQGTADDGLFGFQNGVQTFRLGSDGSAYFKGNVDTSWINATGGYIGDWSIGGGLFNVEADTLLAGGAGGIYAKRYSVWSSFNDTKPNDTSIGYVGILLGNDGKTDTENIGIQATNKNYGVLFEGKNVRSTGTTGAFLTQESSTHGVYINADGIGIGKHDGEHLYSADRIALDSSNGILIGTWTLPEGSTLNLNGTVAGLLDNIENIPVSKITGWDNADLTVKSLISTGAISAASANIAGAATVDSLTTSGQVSAGSISANNLTVNNSPIATVITNTVNAMETLPTKFEDEVKTLAKGTFTSNEFKTAVNETTLTTDSALQLDVISLINDAIDNIGTSTNSISTAVLNLGKSYLAADETTDSFLPSAFNWIGEVQAIAQGEISDYNWSNDNAFKTAVNSLIGASGNSQWNSQWYENNVYPYVEVLLALTDEDGNSKKGDLVDDIEAIVKQTTNLKASQISDFNDNAILAVKKSIRSDATSKNTWSSVLQNDVELIGLTALSLADAGEGQLQDGKWVSKIRNIIEDTDIAASKISGALSNATLATSKLTGTLTSAHFADNTIATSRIINFDKEVDAKVTTMVNSLNFPLIIQGQTKNIIDNINSGNYGSVHAVFA